MWCRSGLKVPFSPNYFSSRNTARGRSLRRSFGRANVSIDARRLRGVELRGGRFKFPEFVLRNFAGAVRPCRMPRADNSCLGKLKAASPSSSGRRSRRCQSPDAPRENVSHAAKNRDIASVGESAPRFYCSQHPFANRLRPYSDNATKLPLLESSLSQSATVFRKRGNLISPNGPSSLLPGLFSDYL